MPELPELEMVRRYLDERIVGKTIGGVTINRKECVNLPPAAYAHVVKGGTVEHVWRKGKMVMIDLSNEVSLIIHLALGGEVSVGKSPEHDLKETQIVFAFTDGSALHFSRLKLGNVHAFPTYHLAATRAGKLGLDALDELPDAGGLQALFGSRGTNMKQLLLDQSLLCGLGNYYSDEVLFRARVSPQSPGKALTSGDFGRLHDAIRDVIADAIRAKGPGGGEFPRHVHGRAGEACQVCSSTISAYKFGNRTGYVCRTCQRKKTARKGRRRP